jgi:polysaccharide export outer membrane protein
MKIPVLAFFLILPSFVIAQPDETSSPTAVPDDFIIGLEDVLAVNVWKEPELSVKEAVVRPDGKISIPLVGDIQASGSTPKQLQERITDKMKEFVASPNVTVVVVKIGSQSVSIVGQVAKPGVYYLGSPLTVLELLARAGGFREDAKIKKIMIVRQDGQKTSHFGFNYKDVSKGQNLQQNITLKNGDVIIVP